MHLKNPGEGLMFRNKKHRQKRNSNALHLNFKTSKSKAKIKLSERHNLGFKWGPSENEIFVNFGSL